MLFFRTVMMIVHVDIYLFKLLKPSLQPTKCVKDAFFKYYFNLNSYIHIMFTISYLIVSCFKSEKYTLKLVCSQSASIRQTTARIYMAWCHTLPYASTNLKNHRSINKIPKAIFHGTCSYYVLSSCKDFNYCSLPPPTRTDFLTTLMMMVENYH